VFFFKLFSPPNMGGISPKKMGNFKGNQRQFDGFQGILMDLINMF